MALPEQIQYQGSAQSVGFNPTAITSPTELIDRNQAGQLRSFEAALAMERQNLDAVNATKLRNQQYEINQLANFSQSLSDMLMVEAEKKNEADMQEGLMMAYMDGLDPAETMAFDIAEGYLKQQDEGIQAYGDAVQASGAPFMGVQQVRNLSGWKQYGYAMGLAQNAASSYGDAIQQMLAELPASMSASEKAVYLSNARAAYFKQSGIMNINPALLNKYAFPGMREVDAQILNRWRKQDEDAAKEEIIAEGQQVLLADPTANFGKAIDTLTRSGMTRGAARAQALKWVESSTEIDDIGSSLSWDGKMTWAEKYPAEFREARREAVKRESGNYDIAQAELQLEGKQWYDQVSEMWEQNPPTDEEVAAADRYMQDTFNGWSDPRLDKWKARTTDAEAAKFYDSQFDSLDRAGMLTEAMLNDPQVPKAVRDRYLNNAKMQDKARTEAPEFKAHMSQIEKDVKRLAGIQGLEPGGPGVELAVAKAQSKFQKDMMAAMQSGTMSPTQAADNAYALFKQQTDLAENQDPNIQKRSDYYYDPTDGFINVIPKGTSQGWTKHLSAVNSALNTKGSNALDSHRLIPEATMKEAMTKINSPNYVYPPIATYISNQLGGTISPWEVMNRQAQAMGLGELPPNPRLQQITQGMRPEFVRMLSYKPSYNSVTRAYASTGAFNPSRVPKGYGQVILDAASANGVDPAILAGLIEVESNFNPKARSEAGAVGIAQIMPGYHPTVDPTNATTSIHYAAKYLRELTNQLGDPLEAIYAYNGGPGGIRKSAENKAYQPKVLKAAAKYGYNPTGNPWTNPAFLNPRLAYVTGNIGPTSTGPHLDVKRADRGNFKPTDLDRYVVVDDPEKGRVPLSKVGTSDGQAEHRARGSHGIDYRTYSGTKVYLKGGAKVVGSTRTEHGDKVTIQLPNGQKYTFLHGRSA